jgi:hypothetical protein
MCKAFLVWKKGKIRSNIKKALINIRFRLILEFKKEGEFGE